MEIRVEGRSVGIPINTWIADMKELELHYTEKKML